MNAQQCNATPAMNYSESNNNYPTDHPVAQTVQNGATASCQETENVSETSSAKQRREERMKKFDVWRQDATGTSKDQVEEDRAGNAN